MTWADIIGAGIFIICIAIIAAVFDAMRDRVVIQPLIHSEKNPDIIGDGAWVTTHAEYPKTAKVRDVPDYQAGV